jgi:8-oxo-dGTP pyrophosphatase MutT (NUDIX family)
VAAVREVKEETGIDARFQSIVAMRHSHNVQFGRDDLYIITRLQPLSMDITVDDEVIILSIIYVSVSQVKIAYSARVIQLILVSFA